MTNSGSRLGGFTLIEVVLAIAILGLLTTVAFSGIRTGLDLWSRGTRGLDVLSTQRVAAVVLRSQLAGALPYLHWPEGRDSRFQLAFSGSAREVAMITTDTFGDGPDGIPRWVSLKWTRRSGTQGTLTIEERAILPPLNQPAAEPVWSGSIDWMDDARLHFLKREPGRVPVWVEEWDSRPGVLPDAIRLSWRANGVPREILAAVMHTEASRSGHWMF